MKLSCSSWPIALSAIIENKLFIELYKKFGTCQKKEYLNKNEKQCGESPNDFNHHGKLYSRIVQIFSPELFHFFIK